MITRPTTGSLTIGLVTDVAPPLAMRITLTTGRLSLGTVAPMIKPPINPPVQPPVVDYVRCPVSSQQWVCIYREGHSGPHSKTPKP